MNMRLIGLFAVFAIAAATVLLLPDEQGQEQENKLLFPDLGLEVANSVNYIKLSAADKTIELKSDEKKVWRIPAEAGYPANTLNIRKILVAMSEVEKVEQKTSQPEYYERLGVEGPEVEASKSKLIELKSPGQTWSLIVGKNSEQLSEGQYVRRTDSAQSWLVNQRFAFQLDIEEWLDTSILHIERDDIHKMSFDYRDKTIKIIRDEESKKMKIENENSMEEHDQIYRSARLASVVDYMKFKKLMPADTELSNEHRQAVAMYETVDGLIVLINVYTPEDVNLFTVSASSSDEADVSVKTRAQAIKALTENRVYEMPDAQKTAMLTSLKEIAETL